MDTQYDKHTLLYQEGRNAMEKGDFPTALLKLKESAALFPHYKTYECIGECLLNEKAYDKAVLYLAAAAGLGRKQSRPFYLLAKALYEVGNLQEGDRAVDEAIRINPSYKAAQELYDSRELRLQGINRSPVEQDPVHL